MSVRALFDAVKVEGAIAPYDTLHLKVIYPAQMSGSEAEQNLGIVPADGAQAPFPVVVFFNGINCAPDVYQWLAIALAERGWVVVTYSWVAENLPGMIALTPGVDLKMWMPDTYGTGATASALPSVLAALERMQQSGVLAGLLDLDRIVLGGHSAGGRVAIESASPQFFPQVKGAFAFAAHSAGVTQLGYPAGTILPLPDALPLLLIGGTCDGVIAQSSFRYGVTWEQPTTPVLRTFEEGIAGGRNDSYLLLLEGANHFAIAHPKDPTERRPVLDFPATQPEEELRRVMLEAIALFLDAHIRKQPEALKPLQKLPDDKGALVAAFACK